MPPKVSNNGSSATTPKTPKNPISNLLGLLEDPEVNKAVGAILQLVLSSALGPRRINRGTQVIQKFLRGESLTYRDGYRLVAAVASVTNAVVQTRLTIERNSKTFYTFIDGLVKKA